MKRKTAVLALFCLPAVLFMGCSDLRAEDTATSTAAYAEEGGFDYGATEESAVADAAGNETGTAVYADGQAADDRKIIRTASMTLEARDYEEALAALRAALGDDVSVHDFRMVAGPKHTKLIFDVLVPQALERSDADVCAMARKLVQALDPAWDAVVNVDRPYV